MKNLELLRGIEKVAKGAKEYRDPDDGKQVVMHTLSLVDIAKETLRRSTMMTRRHTGFLNPRQQTKFWSYSVSRVRLN